MKSVIIVTLVTISIGVLAVPQGGLSPEAEQEMMRQMEKCTKESGVDPNSLSPEKMTAENLNQEMKCFHACMSQEAGMMNEDGSINKQKLLTFPPNMPQDLKEYLTRLRTPCAELKGNDKCDTGFLLFKCLTTPPPQASE